MLVNKNWMRAQRTALMEAQGGKCYYCGCGMTWGRMNKNRCTLDHKTPMARGGRKHDPANVVACCFQCNGLKGHLTEVEFRAVLAARAVRSEAKPAEGGTPHSPSPPPKE